MGLEDTVTKDGTKVIIECGNEKNTEACYKNILSVLKKREMLIRMMPKSFLRK